MSFFRKAGRDFAYMDDNLNGSIDDGRKALLTG